MELGLKVRPTTMVDRPNLGLMVSLLLNLNKEGYHRNNTYEESKCCKKRSINRRTVAYLPSLYGN